MSLEKTLLMNELFDCYQGLLTKKQRKMLELYYKEDFTLAEIAEHYDISRQGVHDNIRRGEESLENYEAMIQLNHLRKEKYQLLKQLKKTDLNDQQSDIISQLEEL